MPLVPVAIKRIIKDYMYTTSVAEVDETSVSPWRPLRLRSHRHIPRTHSFIWWTCEHRRPIARCHGIIQQCGLQSGQSVL